MEDGTHIRAGAGLAQQQINEGHGRLLFGVFVQDNGWELGAVQLGELRVRMKMISWMVVAPTPSL
jgi:hypothetical protein